MTATQSRSVDTAASTASAADPASWWRRVAATVVDALTVFFMLWALVVLRVFWFMSDLSEAIDPEPWGNAFVATVTYTVLFAIYQVVFLGWNDGRTPGMDVCGVRITGVDGGMPTRSQVVRRVIAVAPLWLAPPVAAALVLTVASGVPALFGARRRSWADLVAGTTAVRFLAPATESVGRRERLASAAEPPSLFSIVVGRRTAERFRRSSPEESS
ncbi:MAG: RDD family protein [Acidimicrobiia bacterium]